MIEHRQFNRFGNDYLIININLDDQTFTSARAINASLTENIQQEMQRVLSQDCHYKIQYVAKCQFKRTLPGEGREDIREQFLSLTAEEVNRDAYEPYLEQAAQRIDEKITEYQNLGSNFRIDKIREISLRCVKFQPICRLRGHSYIATPKELNPHNKGIINPQNKGDNLCFIYSILIILLLDVIQKNRQRVQQYVPYFHLLRFKESDMPMKICDIPKFERQNPHVSINVLEFKESTQQDSIFQQKSKSEGACEHPYIRPLYRSQNKDQEAKRVNLLLIREKTSYHYVAIKNLNALINGKLPEGRFRGLWCSSCFLGFWTKKSYESHLPLCSELAKGHSVYTMPLVKDLSFSNWHKTIPCPYVVYADFESILSTKDKDDEKVEKHIPCAAAYLFTSDFVNISQPLPQKYDACFGPSAIVWFLHSLEMKAREISDWFQSHGKQKMLPLTPHQEKSFEEATFCYMCQCEMTNKYHDHNHFTGQYIGAACLSCNMARRVRYPFLPVVFHNLRGYDMHHIIKYGVERMDGWSLRPIAQTSERFIAMSVQITHLDIGIRFIDSLQFLNASLSKLVQDLPDEDFILTNSEPTIPPFVKHSKGVFPYSYADSFKGMMEKTEIPTKDAFFNVLSQKVDVTDHDYETMRQAWQEAGCRHLVDYMMMYLKLDVYQLADVFQSFRKTALREDGLDPCHFFSIPGLSWDSALKMVEKEKVQKLELLLNVEMYEFYEAGIRGGMTFVNKHYVCANEQTQLLYIDINNLYGWALSQKLPCNDFKFIYDQLELEKILSDLPQMNTEQMNYGYTLEVDIFIPSNLHDYLDQLPPAPVNKCPLGKKVKKLLLTHEPKTHYIIHFRLLQFYMNHLGVEVTKVHRAVQFQQDYVFKSYIEYNSKRRAATKNKFEKDYYKLKNNSLYGKTVENVRKRTNLRLCQNRKRLAVYSSRPTFKRTIHISDDLVAVLLLPELVTLNRPIYVGQSVLDISKLRMYELHYVELEKYRKEFQCEINIVAGDTDSFFLECINVDLRTQLLPAMIRDQLLDTSNYESSDPLYSSQLASRIGKFKDESGGGIDPFVEWIFLRPKCYSLLSQSQHDHRRSKGVMLHQTSLSHLDFKNEFMIHERKRRREEEDVDDDEINEEEHESRRYVKQRRIGSKNHQLYTIIQSKVALNINDDKRHWIGCNESLAYGHYSI